MTHLDPPNKEEELAESVETRQGQMRRREARRDEYKLAPVYKINAFRVLTTRKAKENFDLREAGWDHADGAKSHDELLNKAKGYARKRNLDN